MLTRFKNLNLRFVVEGDSELGGGEPVVDSTVDVVSTEAESVSGDNPAWGSLKEKLDPISYHSIQDELKAMDAAANQRITSVNKSYEPWKQLADSGTTPEQIQQALSISEKLNANPEEIYTALGTFLENNGRLPSKQELTQEIAEQSEETEDDPRYSALEEQNQKIMQFLQDQQQQQAAQAADKAIDTEIEQLRAAHPELAPEDVKEVIRRAALDAQSTGKAPTLEEAFVGFNALRNRILSTPRPADSAPNLIPTSGGVPSSTAQRSLGSLSRLETQNLISDLLEKNKG